MTCVWANGPSASTDRFVLLALADYANDDGICWPSVAGLMAKTCMSERGVQTVLRRLVAGGFLQISAGGGRSNNNTYTIKTPQQTAETPHQKPRISQQTPHDVPPLEAETPQQTTETPHLTALNPAPGAPEPSITIIEPSEKKVCATRFDEFWKVYPHRGGAKKGRKPAEVSYSRSIRSGASEQDIIDGAMRSAMDRQVKAGFVRNPATWLNQNGWEDEIDTSREGGTNGNGNHINGNPPATGRDSFLDEIAIAARSRPAQGGFGN
jgi:hypothetical protein